MERLPRMFQQQAGTSSIPCWYAQARIRCGMMDAATRELWAVQKRLEARGHDHEAFCHFLMEPCDHH
jgi:hypothetical protein